MTLLAFVRGADIGNALEDGLETMVCVVGHEVTNAIWEIIFSFKKGLNEKEKPEKEITL